MYVNSRPEFGVTVCGHEHGPPMAIIHGAVTFQGCRPLLLQRTLTHSCRLIDYHRRGYGGIPLARQGCTIGDLAADARAILQQLDARHAHLLGHSIGALIAIQLAIDSPELVRTLTLVEPTYASRPEVLTWFEGAITPIRDAYEKQQSEHATDLLLRLIDGQNYRDRLDRCFGSGWFEASSDAMTTYFERDLPAAVTWRLPVDIANLLLQPVLILLGADSPSPFHQIAADLDNHLPDSIVVVVPDATHNVIACRPDLVAAHVKAFIAPHEHFA